MDAFTLLEENHRRAESLLIFLRAAPDAEKSVLLSELARLFEKDGSLEETVIYPELRGLEPTAAKVRQAEQARARMRTQLDVLQQLEPATRVWQEAFHSLDVSMRHHFQQERTGLFPAAREALSREQLDRMTERVTEERTVEAEHAVGEAALAPGPATTASAVSQVREGTVARERRTRAAGEGDTRPRAAAAALHLPSEETSSRAGNARRRLDRYYRRIATTAARPGVWFGGAVIAGVVLSSLLRAAGREREQRIAYQEEMSHGRIR